jgi:uncharacterized protein DUF6361
MSISSLTWLDFSERERRKAHEAIAQFREQDTRDELGVGVVRDAFADLLFPGTGTLQTRAAYFLLVPWMYLELEGKKVPSREIGTRARTAELKLIDVLAASADQEGTIGIQARAALQRVASSIYWQGLGVWGIRSFPGSQDAYHRSLDSFYLARQSGARNDDGEPVGGSIPRNWHHAIPPSPPKFPNQASMGLRKIDAEYLRERLLSRAPASLLALFLDRGYTPGTVNYAWEHPRLADFPGHLREQLDHGRRFSDVIHGAVLLYNLMLAEKSRQETRVDEYRHELQAWSHRMVEADVTLRRWDRSRFWQLVDGAGAHVTPQTRAFIDAWVEFARTPSDGPLEERARRLIHDREWALKRGQARLENPRALERWGGASGTRPLNYRWPVAKTMIADIQRGLAGDASHA